MSALTVIGKAASHVLKLEDRSNRTEKVHVLEGLADRVHSRIMEMIELSHELESDSLEMQGAKIIVTNCVRIHNEMQTRLIALTAE